MDAPEGAEGYSQVGVEVRYTIYIPIWYEYIGPSPCMADWMGRSSPMIVMGWLIPFKDAALDLSWSAGSLVKVD